LAFRFDVFFATFLGLAVGGVFTDVVQLVRNASRIDECAWGMATALPLLAKKHLERDGALPEHAQHTPPRAPRFCAAAESQGTAASTRLPIISGALQRTVGGYSLSVVWSSESARSVSRPSGSF